MRSYVFVFDEAGDIHFACVNDVGIAKNFSHFINSEFYNVYVIRYSQTVEATIGALLSGGTKLDFALSEDLVASDAPHVNESFLQMHRTTFAGKVFCSFGYGGLPVEVNTLHEAFYNWVKANAVLL